MSDPVQRNFPDTHESLVQALNSQGEASRTRALDLVGRAYRLPLVTLLERKWSLQRADAEDLAHEFLTTAFEKNWLPRYDATRGKFRTFLRSCLFAFAADEHAHNHRLKRGGHAEHEYLDANSVGVPTDDVVDDLFEREWMRSVLQLALNALRDDAHACGKDSAFALFEQYDIVGSEADARPTYQTLAKEFTLPVTQVTNYLAWARRRFREHVLQTIRALTASETEYRDEVRALLGIDV